MWPDRRLTDLLKVKHPIIQAPMAGASTPQMAAASANAGCIGSLGCAMMSAETYLKTFNETRALTNAALNMNFFCHQEAKPDAQKSAKLVEAIKPYYDGFGLSEIPEPNPTHFPFNEKMAETVLKTNPAVVSFHFGLPDDEIVSAFKAQGIKIFCSATTVDEARHLEEKGVDAIIAQGWEAGGHHGFYLENSTAAIGTMALVPQLVDAVNVPVIAAGGIADGRGIVAAFALGASGVQIGTAFLTCAESGISKIHHETLLKSSGQNTAVTKAFSGRPARGVINRFMRETEPLQDALPDFPIMNTLTGPLRKASVEANSPDFVALWSGQAVGLNRETSVSGLIEQMVDEAGQVFQKQGKGG